MNKMLPDLARLNSVMCLSGGAMHLHVVEDRYGAGCFVAFLSATEDKAADLASYVDGGWTEGNFYVKYGLGELSWYPVAYGNNFWEAIQNLAHKLNAVPQEHFDGQSIVSIDSLWARTVVFAEQDVLEALKKSHEPKLPKEFAEYIDRIWRPIVEAP